MNVAVMGCVVNGPGESKHANIGISLPGTGERPVAPVYEDGEKTYIIAPQRLKAGDTVVAGEKTDVKPGNAAPLSGLPIGTIIHNVELKPLKGGQMARSAGAYGYGNRSVKP
jgi:hypothetical protein